MATTSNSGGASYRYGDLRQFRSRRISVENAIPKPLRLRSRGTRSEASEASVEHGSPDRLRAAFGTRSASRTTHVFSGVESRPNESLVRTLDASAVYLGVGPGAAHFQS